MPLPLAFSMTSVLEPLFNTTTINVSRALTIVAALYRSINIISSSTITLDPTGLVNNQQLLIANTGGGGAAIVQALGALIGGAPQQTVKPGESGALCLIWNSAEGGWDIQ